MSGDVAPRSAGRRSGGLGAWLMPPDFTREREYTARDWVEALVEPVALVVLIMLFVGGVTRFLQVLAPGWDSRFLAIIALVVSIEAFLYGRRLARPTIRPKEWAALLVPPAIVLKLLPYVLGTASLVVDVPEWLRSPASVFSADYIVGLLLMLLAWEMALGATVDLGNLRVQRGEIPSADDRLRVSPLDADDSSWRHVDHATPYRRLSARVIWGGVALVMLSALAALETAQMLNPEAMLELVTFRRPGPATSLASVIAYFFVGLLFLAEAAYVRRRTAWQVERLVPPGSVGAGWMTQAAVGVVAVTLVALALPTSYALTLSQLFGILMSGVVAVMQLIIGTIMFIIMTILYPFTLLFSGTGTESQPPGPMPTPAPAPPPTPIPWLDVAQSLVFWLIALGIVAYVASVLWRKRPPMPDWVGAGILGRVWAALAALIRSLRRAGAATARRVAAVLPRIRPRPAIPIARPFRFISLRRLGPRELVEYFYLSVVERATRLGFGKEVGETAAEYSRRLPERFPDSEPDLHELTDAFLEARYGPRQVDEGLVSAARARWQALKLKLRARRVARSRSSGQNPTA